MVRYAPDHKNKTRQSILRQAGRLFRRKGFSGVSIDAVMDAARLTRGGFYGHFSSKDDLLANVVGSDHDFTERMQARSGRSPEELNREAIAIARAYLDPKNQRGVSTGCTFAALIGDIGRAPAQIRKRFSAAFRGLLGEFDRGLEADGPSPQALRAVTLAVGAVALARACDDRDLEERLLAAATEGVVNELAN